MKNKLNKSIVIASLLIGSSIGMIACKKAETLSLEKDSNSLVEYNNHKYIQFGSSNYSNNSSLVHNPDCELRDMKGLLDSLDNSK